MVPGGGRDGAGRFLDPQRRGRTRRDERAGGGGDGSGAVFVRVADRRKPERLRAVLAGRREDGGDHAHDVDLGDERIRTRRGPARAAVDVRARVDGGRSGLSRRRELDSPPDTCRGKFGRDADAGGRIARNGLGDVGLGERRGADADGGRENAPGLHGLDGDGQRPGKRHGHLVFLHDGRRFDPRLELADGTLDRHRRDVGRDHVVCAAMGRGGRDARNRLESRDAPLRRRSLRRRGGRRDARRGDVAGPGGQAADDPRGDFGAQAFPRRVERVRNGLPGAGNPRSFVGRSRGGVRDALRVRRNADRLPRLDRDGERSVHRRRSGRLLHDGGRFDPRVAVADGPPDFRRNAGPGRNGFQGRLVRGGRNPRSSLRTSLRRRMRGVARRRHERRRDRRGGADALDSVRLPARDPDRGGAGRRRRIPRPRRGA